jgi:hypothetical protein
MDGKPIEESPTEGLEKDSRPGPRAEKRSGTLDDMLSGTVADEIEDNHEGERDGEGRSREIVVTTRGEPVGDIRNGDTAKPFAPELTPGKSTAEGPVLADPSFPVSPKPMRARRWSKLESISIENFKAIAKTTVALGGRHNPRRAQRVR